MFIDEPDPGMGYIMTNFLVMLFLLSLPICLKSVGSLRSAFFLPICAICVGGAVVFGLFLHAGFNTRYVIDGAHISVRNGLMQRTTIPLKSIERIDNRPLIWQPIGFTLKWKGYSNRWTNGVSLTTAQRVVFLSPRNIDGFVTYIRQKSKYIPPE